MTKPAVIVRPLTALPKANSQPYPKGSPLILTWYIIVCADRQPQSVSHHYSTLTNRHGRPTAPSQPSPFTHYRYYPLDGMGHPGHLISRRKHY